jgi:hypothetical protein
VYKKGKFSAIEEQQLTGAIQAYKKVGLAALKARMLSVNHSFQENEIDDAGFNDIVFAKNGATKNNAFWSALSACSAASCNAFSNTITATAVPMRPIIAIYHHVRRVYHPLRAQGKWMPSEDALLKAYARCDV